MLSSLVKTNYIKLTLLAVTTAKIPIGQKQTTEKIERANKHGLLSADRRGNGLCKNNEKKITMPTHYKGSDQSLKSPYHKAYDQIQRIQPKLFCVQMPVKLFIIREIIMPICLLD